MYVRKLETGKVKTSNNKDSQTPNLIQRPTCHFPAFTPEVVKCLFTEKTAENLPVPKMEILQIICVKICKIPECRRKQQQKSNPILSTTWRMAWGSVGGLPPTLILPSNCEGAKAERGRGREELSKAAPKAGER